MSPPATMAEGEARQAVLIAADEAFYRHGIGAVTMGDIRDHSSVSLRRIYSLYETKADLVAGWLRFRHNTWMTWFTDETERRESEGVRAIDAAFDALSAWLISTDYRGCGFINTLAETSDLTDEHRDIIRHHKQALVDLLAGLATRTGVDGEAMAVLIDGAIVQSTVFASVNPVEAARRAAHAMQPKDGQ